MAAVLTVLGPCVKMLIKEVQGEVSMVLGVPNDITMLERRMESLSPFIPDAERRRVTDQSVQRWYSNLTNTMYDTTDILEKCKLEGDKRRESRIARLEEKVHSCFHPLLFFLHNPIFAHQIGRRIKDLNQRLDNISKAAVGFNFNTDVSYQDMRMLREAENSSRRSMSEFDESAIVGKIVENDTKLLVQELITYDNQNIKVVSIEGMGGIGKTTLAQKIFNEKTIQEHFKTRIWLGIGRHFDQAELLRSAIKHAGRDHGNERDISLLVRTLTDALSTTKFLIVMDDMCSEEVWDNLLSVPIRNASQKQQGSRVVITTRLEDMALKMGTSFHHHVSPLDAEDAWSLLKKQLTPNQVVGIDHLKNIGMEILKRCDGLPLAIKVMGGVLSTKYPSEGDWKTVLDSPAWSWSSAGLPSQLDSRLNLSYGELSPQLKQCFLYCSLIPKGKDIEQDVVARMWISEGFIQSVDGNSTASSHEYGLEDIAINYYHELRKRNLIETGRRYSLTGYRCTLHDVVRSFAEYVPREELMVVANREQLAAGGGGGGEMLVRRLSIGHVVSEVEWATLQRRESLRTLIIINSKVGIQPGDTLGGFSSLRVLYICSTDCNGLVASLSGLKHLRYLHLEDTDISMLPDDIHKMKFLLYISLINCKKLGHLPSSIIELVQLRSLDIRGSKVSAMPNGFGRLTNLRSLSGFQLHMDMDAGSSCLSKQLVPLSQLRDLTIENLGKVTTSRMVEKDMISSKSHLTYIVFNYSASGHTVGPRGGAEQQQQQSVMEEALEKLRPPNCLYNLTVKGGYVGRQLPNWMNAPESVGFRSLRLLTLENLHCCTQLPDGLCCLRSLEVLTIFHAPAIKSIGSEFQASSPSVAGDSAAILAPFPKLKKLQLSGLCEWEEWEWKDPEEQEGVMKDIIAMPCLQLLHIKNCKLRCLPPGLANCNRHALRVVELYQVSNLTSLENFPSVTNLDVFDCRELKKISGFSRLQKIRIVRCPNLQVLEGVPALNNIVLKHAIMETLPEFLESVKPRYLELCCSKKLKESLSSPGSSEWMKIRHIEILNIM